MSQIVQNLSDISDQYEALFVDLWGCVHNGVEAYPAANEALIAYRKRGGKVVLVTNSPRPRSSVAEQIKEFGVSDHAWDSIATSGDSARAAMFQGVVGEAVYFIGEPRDKGFFEPLKLLEHPVQITCVALDQASGIVCTGPFDSNADPEVMLPELEIARAKGLKFLCANPDIVVDRGAHREWCCGRIGAALYANWGGKPVFWQTICADLRFGVSSLKGVGARYFPRLCAGDWRWRANRCQRRLGCRVGCAVYRRRACGARNKNQA